MLELQIFSANVLLPFALLCVAMASARWLSRSEVRLDNPREPAENRPLEQTLILSTAIASLWAAFGMRVGFSWWPEDSWARLPQMFAWVGLGCLCANWISEKTLAGQLLKWCLCAVCIGLAANAMIPTGEGWEPLKPMHPVWWCMLTLCPLLSCWAIHRLDRISAAVLGLGWIVCIAACAFLTSSFLRVTEPLFAIATLLGCASVGTLVLRRNYVVAFAAPCIFAVCAIVANAQFNSYADLPDALSWFAMSAAPLAALLSLAMSRSGHASSAYSKRAITVTLLTCLLLAAAIAAWTYVANAST